MKCLFSTRLNIPPRDRENTARASTNASVLVCESSKADDVNGPSYSIPVLPSAASCTPSVSSDTKDSFRPSSPLPTRARTMARNLMSTNIPKSKRKSFVIPIAQVTNLSNDMSEIAFTAVPLLVGLPLTSFPSPGGACWASALGPVAVGSEPSLLAVDNTASDLRQSCTSRLMSQSSEGILRTVPSSNVARWGLFRLEYLPLFASATDRQPQPSLSATAAIGSQANVV
mmetsp:Transcript_14578/g.31600  ORF Transcript_14578/g.31600 Transcript_14578/m.31600 type:complete len:228 (+) Transcript_14578:2761-3444(+)